MNKEVNLSKKSRSKSNRNYNFDIEKAVDKILLDKKSSSKEIYFRKFSPEQHQNDSIYFLREKKETNKKDNAKSNPDKLFFKIKKFKFKKSPEKSNNEHSIKAQDIKKSKSKKKPKSEVKKGSVEQQSKKQNKDKKASKKRRFKFKSSGYFKRLKQKKVEKNSKQGEKKLEPELELKKEDTHTIIETSLEKPNDNVSKKSRFFKKSQPNVKDKTLIIKTATETQKEIQTTVVPKKKKLFGKGISSKEKKDDKIKKDKKGFFSKKSKKQLEKEDTSKEDTKKKRIDKKTLEHLDEFVKNLTTDEAQWLDKKINATKGLDTDFKEDTIRVTSSISQSEIKQELSKKHKFFKKGTVSKKEKKEKIKKDKKGILSKKPHAEVYELPYLKVDKQKKEVILSTKDGKSGKDVIITEKEITQFTKKKDKALKKQLRKGKQKESTILDDGFTKTQTKKKEDLIDSIVSDGKIKVEDRAQELKEITIKKLGYTEGSWEELDFYPLQEPFAYVQIIREKDTLDKRYILAEVELSEKESHLIKFIKETLTGLSINTFEIEESGEKKYLIDEIDKVLEDYMINLSDELKNKVIYFLEKEYLGLNKLEELMQDPNIEDISCDGSGVPIFLYHRKYGSLKGSVQFDDEDELSAFVVRLAQKCGKHISIAEPMLDATMPDGSRIQMTLSTEVTTKGSTFTIRKFKEDPFSPPDLIEFNTMSSEMIAYMWVAVENGINALVAGGTAAGKTSTLNALSLFIPRESKIVSIEETREINLPHPNWIPGVSRSGFGEVVGNKVIGEIDLYDLMKAALRQRPEYILVGEIRGREAYVLFQAMSTGHTTYSTVHADSAQSLIHRLEGKPINIPRIMLQALDIVCIQVISRIKNKRARRVKQIIEIIDIDPATKEILTNEVFKWDPVEDKFIYSGKSYILERVRAEKDKTREEMTNEIKNRAKLLEWMNTNNVREFKKVATLISQYFDNPEQVMKKITVKT